MYQVRSKTGEVSRPSKVVIVMPLGHELGGAELVLWHLLVEARDVGIEWFLVFLSPGPLVDRVRKLGVDAIVVDAGRLRQPYRSARAIADIASLARQVGADLFVGWMSKGQLYAGSAAVLARVPSVWYQLGIPSSGSWLERTATGLPAKGILTCSRAGARAQAALRPRRAVRVVYPGVDLGLFDPAKLATPEDTRRALGLAEPGPWIGMVGRLQSWKGMHVLIEAMPTILRRHPNARCLIVGNHHALEPDYLRSLETLVRRLELQGLVDVKVRASGPEWVQGMDVMVHASDNEPFGIVVIEAMALGKPVVAGAQGGPSEVITDGVNGLLSPFGDADALAGAVLRYLDDRAFASAVGDHARRRATDFSVRSYASALVATIREFAY